MATRSASTILRDLSAGWTNAPCSLPGQDLTNGIESDDVESVIYNSKQRNYLKGAGAESATGQGLWALSQGRK
jgi:hypothetical protein